MFPIQSVLLFAIAAFLAYFFLSGFIWGAGYAPTSRKEIDTALRLLNLKENSKFYDLGSGYGRMVIAAAEKSKLSTTGVEIDPIKCWWTNLAIKRKKLLGRARVIRSNFFDVNLRDADGIFVFLSSETHVMQKLQEKIFKESKPGTKVISYVHRFKSWTPSAVERNLFLYIVPALPNKEKSQR